MVRLVSARERWLSPAYFLSIRDTHATLSVHSVSEGPFQWYIESFQGRVDGFPQRLVAFAGCNVPMPKSAFGNRKITDPLIKRLDQGTRLEYIRTANLAKREFNTHQSSFFSPNSVMRQSQPIRHQSDQCI